MKLTLVGEVRAEEDGLVEIANATLYATIFLLFFCGMEVVPRVSEVLRGIERKEISATGRHH